MTLINIIFKYIQSKYPLTVHKGQIEMYIFEKKLKEELNFEIEHVGRRCRDLVKQGQIERITNEDRTVSYRYIPQKLNVIEPKREQVKLFKVRSQDV